MTAAAIRAVKTGAIYGVRTGCKQRKGTVRSVRGAPGVAFGGGTSVTSSLGWVMLAQTTAGPAKGE